MKTSTAVEDVPCALTFKKTHSSVCFTNPTFSIAAQLHMVIIMKL
jgi:hypothetical protein